MTRWLLALALAGGLAACGGGGDSTPSATLATTRTTLRTSTTLSAEAEVEAAYLKSWDVLATAGLAVDATGLSQSYDGKALELVRADVSDLKSKGAKGRFAVEHHYEIHVDPHQLIAQVIDHYVNHSVLLDAKTGQPTEPDPNKQITETYWLKRIGGVWKVVDIVRS